MATQQAKYLGNIVVLFVFLACFNSVGRASDDYPRSSTVYNTKEDSNITFECTVDSIGELVCEATQTSITNKTSQSTKEVVSAATSQWEDGQRLSTNECALYRTMLEFFEGRSPPPSAAAKNFMDAMPEAHRLDFILSAEALIRYCNTPNLRNFLAVVKLDHDKKIRTCKVMTFHWSQRFYQAGPETWTAKPEPIGECGVVRLDRFERVKPSADYDLNFWDYISKKAVTNPKGSTLTLPCSELDENEYLFSWKKRDLNRSCDYVEFN